MQAIDDPSENKIQCKHKHKQSHSSGNSFSLGAVQTQA